MYIRCKCGSTHFLIDMRPQGKYEYICAKCGEYIEDIIPSCEVICGESVHDQSIDLEEWEDESKVVYFVSLYDKSQLVGRKKFTNIQQAELCYVKCIDIFTSVGKLSAVLKLFDDC